MYEEKIPFVTGDSTDVAFCAKPIQELRLKIELSANITSYIFCLLVTGAGLKRRPRPTGVATPHKANKFTASTYGNETINSVERNDPPSPSYGRPIHTSTVLSSTKLVGRCPYLYIV